MEDEGAAIVLWELRGRRTMPTSQFAERLSKSNHLFVRESRPQTREERRLPGFSLEWNRVSQVVFAN